ncbi:hypothetical protein GCM10027598_65640 [Amycolatopsis oliviviridis]|uniref:Uncharacterized protein n=1 Tax=Amycolatopsis oliviviridis TaxID=1471590 RepID=A0ABQ3M8F9_9PSEU|nr:hypothetical protein GCM10017790_79240 [Amycolatopsis oliviviridis]
MGFAAGAEHQPDPRLLFGQRPDAARRERGILQRPHLFAVHTHFVFKARAGFETGQHQQRVVVAPDLERAGGRPEDFDLTRGVGLDPHRRRCRVDVSQQGSQAQTHS